MIDWELATCFTAVLNVLLSGAHVVTAELDLHGLLALCVPLLPEEETLPPSDQDAPSPPQVTAASSWCMIDHLLHGTNPTSVKAEAAELCCQLYRNASVFRALQQLPPAKMPHKPQPLGEASKDKTRQGKHAQSQQPEKKRHSSRRGASADGSSSASSSPPSTSTDRSTAAQGPGAAVAASAAGATGACTDNPTCAHSLCR